MEKDTLWLPDGYGTGTIIYDNFGKPWQATKKMVDGAGIYEVVKVSDEYAKEKIAGGAGHLVSKEVK